MSKPRVLSDELDLSFDLMFGEDSGSPSSPTSDPILSSSVSPFSPPSSHSSPLSPRNSPPAHFHTGSPLSGKYAASRLTSSSLDARAQSPLLSEEELRRNAEREIERDRNALLVHSSHSGDSFNTGLILRYLGEQLPHSIKTYHYRDKQNFCFVQCHTEELANAAVGVLNGITMDGSPLRAQRVQRVTPGKDPLEAETTIEPPTATLVIKNLPFALKLEQLKAVLSSYPVRPENVAFHYDSARMFRGMAFVKYTRDQDAEMIFDQINGMDVGGRSIRVEYKRKKEQRPLEYDPSDEEMKKIHDQLLHFKTQSKHPTLTFPSSLTSYQRRQIHIVADKLDLDHYSEGPPDNHYLVIAKREIPGEPVRTSTSYDAFVSGCFSPGSMSSMSSISSPFGSWTNNELPPPRSSWRDRSSSFSGASQGSSSGVGVGAGVGVGVGVGGLPSALLETPTGSRARQGRRSSVSGPTQMAKSPKGAYSRSSQSSGSVVKPVVGSLSLSGSISTSRRDRIADQSLFYSPAVSPVRQPFGPEAGKGFSEAYQKRRMATICLSPQGSPRLPVVQRSIPASSS